MRAVIRICESSGTRRTLLARIKAKFSGAGFPLESNHLAKIVSTFASGISNASKRCAFLTPLG